MEDEQPVIFSFTQCLRLQFLPFITRSEWPSFLYQEKFGKHNSKSQNKNKTNKKPQTNKKPKNENILNQIYYLHSSSKIGYNSSLIKVIFSFPPFQKQNKANQSRTKMFWFFFIITVVRDHSHWKTTYKYKQIANSA